MRILAVDDEPFILELIPMIAAKSGFRDLTTASSGELALAALANTSQPFECLLLDVNMPGMDGIELCAKVRQIEGYRTTPILMLTAMSDRDYLDKAFKAGATDYTTKPIDIKDFGLRLRAVRRLLSERREAEAAQANHDGTTSDPEWQHGFAPSDAIYIEGVADLVDFGSLKNYLTQCSRSANATSQLLATKVDGFAQYYASSSSEDLISVLRDVAKSFYEVLNPIGGLISYSGAGIFVSVSAGDRPISASEVEADLQKQLDAKYPDGGPFDIQISVGGPIKLAYDDTHDVAQSLERAIASVESRSKEKLAP